MRFSASGLGQGFWNGARPGAIWDELADETQVAAITYAKLLVSNQVWARACPGATCQDLPTRPKQLERGVYIIRFSESGLGQGLRIEKPERQVGDEFIPFQFFLSCRCCRSK
jgi:hypothetical protein